MSFKPLKSWLVCRCNDGFRAFIRDIGNFWFAMAPN